MNSMSMTGTATSAIPMSTSSGSMSSMGSTNMNTGIMMIFSNDNTAVSIFSNAFSPTTTAQYVGAWFFVFLLAIIWRALVSAQLKTDQYWTRKYASRQILIKNSKEDISLENEAQAWRWSTHLPSAALAFVTQTVAYLLMIIVMILNIGLFFAVILGYFVGELVFGRVGFHSSYGSGGCT